MKLKVEMDYQRGVLIARLAGELDHHTSDQVRAQLDEAIMRQQCEHLVLNFKDLQFMDSSGLGVILGRYKLLKQKNGKMAVCDATPAVYRLLEMSGLFKIMTCYENEEVALSGMEVVS
ncbi:anti-sigma F factor antagonist [Paenibacillus terreus]|uniref:Anti-sigma F factor antagonist n=1 Tax=Paenibacillus terreus TaxID=1387834 RepID=A0ABV5B2C2_9BACL